MLRLSKPQIMYLLAGAALMVALLVSYKALAALLVLIFAAPIQSKRAAIKEQVKQGKREAGEQERAEQATREAKTEAGERASNDVDSFIDGDW